MLSAPHRAFLIACALVTLAAAYSDFRHGRIRNRTIVAALMLGLFARVWVALATGDLGSLAASLLGGLLGLVMCASVPALLLALRAIGAGDVKLLGACGLLLGPVKGLELSLYAFGFASIYALLRFAYDGSLLRVLSASAVALTNPLLPTRLRRSPQPEALGSIRFAPAVALGAQVLLLSSWGQR